MSSELVGTTPPEPASEPRHGVRIGVIWAVLTAIAVPIVVLVWGPHLPPGGFSAQAAAQRHVNVVLSGVVTPIILLVVVYFLYAVVVFRQRGPVISDGPPIQGHRRIQVAWIAVSVVIVLFAAAYGTVGLFGQEAGAGGGQGPVPLSVPSGTPMPIQVIAQQWGFTYRYPTYGGVETYTLAIPADSSIEFHVTSLDVIHSFWAIQLGVKADAVQAADNVAFLRSRSPAAFTIRCSELCGLWHAQMGATGRVLSKSDFASWIAQQQRDAAPISKYLPPYSTTYLPDPRRRGG